MSRKLNNHVLIAVRIPAKTKRMLGEIAKKEGLNESIVIRQELEKNLPRRYNKK